ncbi:hypothetical protein GCM10022221_68820 [Actinocorallia aurea]
MQGRSGHIPQNVVSLLFCGLIGRFGTRRRAPSFTQTAAARLIALLRSASPRMPGSSGNGLV